MFSKSYKCVAEVTSRNLFLAMMRSTRFGSYKYNFSTYCSFFSVHGNGNILCLIVHDSSGFLKRQVISYGREVASNTCFLYAVHQV